MAYIVGLQGLESLPVGAGKSNCINRVCVLLKVNCKGLFPQPGLNLAM